MGVLFKCVVPGIAADNSLKTHPAALDCAIFFYRLKCVLRAAWVKTAGFSDEGFYAPLVNADNCDKQKSHMTL